MALKLNLNISKEDIAKAHSEVGGQYTGPTPPADLYNVAVKGLWAGENKNGAAVLIVRLVINEKGDKAVYNGFSILHRMNIPSDPTDQYFSIQIKSLDDFFKAITKGEMDIEDFSKAANGGKIQVGEKDKIGEPISQIARFRIEKAADIRVKTKPPTKHGDREYVNVHYIDSSSVVAKTKDEDDDVDDFDMDDSDVDDIDDMLNDLED